MRYALLTLCTCLLALGAPACARAQDSPADLLPAPESGNVIQEQARQFYKRCYENPDPTLSPEGQEEYCVCLSAQIYRQSLTPEERSFLATGGGQPMDEKRALSEVYGQCIGIPGRAATYSRCTLSPKAYKMVRGEKELDAMCRCILQEMSDFWDVVAPTFLEVEMMRNRDVEDPLQYVLKSRDFPVLFSEKRSKCVSKFGRRD